RARACALDVRSRRGLDVRSRRGLVATRADRESSPRVCANAFLASQPPPTRMPANTVIRVKNACDRSDQASIRAISAARSRTDFFTYLSLKPYIGIRG